MNLRAAARHSSGCSMQPLPQPYHNCLKSDEGGTESGGGWPYQICLKSDECGKERGPTDFLIVLHKQ